MEIEVMLAAAVRREKVSNACCRAGLRHHQPVYAEEMMTTYTTVKGHVCAGGGVQRNNAQQNSRSPQPSFLHRYIYIYII
jgi:hypothetical protein